MTSVLLRPYIILVHRCRGPFKVTVVSGPVFVDIRFHGPHAEIADLLHALPQEKTKPDPGQIRILRILVRLHVQQDPSVCENSDFIVHPQDRLV